MGDSDSLKNYISDYLENSLDPSTHKEFDDALKRSPQLSSMTDRMATLLTHLNKLRYHKCSDKFLLKLRERIHTSSEPLISRQNMIRYSFAASLVIILVIATFSITNLSSESPDTTPALKGLYKSPVNNTNPVSNPVSGNDANTFVKDGDLNVNTKSNQRAISDSTGSETQPEKKKEKPPIKFVDQKE
ncbi:MAG: hypothetical protein KAS58_00630 [Calditrichia bacterium]|nr:hypothetical protein [Calditrichia bacterium]